MKKRLVPILVLPLLGLLLASIPFVRSYSIESWWDDDENIVMDNVLMPPEIWAPPAEWQMSEWNEIDTTDNSHPFRVSLEPEFSFGYDDGDNTIGFLDEAGLGNEYGLNYSGALAWTIPVADGDYRYIECDIAFNPALPWSLGPDDQYWFQSSVLHELGHCRALNHYNNYFSMLNVDHDNQHVSKYLRGETLYMDDKEAIRQHASHVQESDMVVYNKWHDGSLPQWMTISPTSLREHDTIQLNGITVENRGTVPLGGELRLGVYLSKDPVITPSDTFVDAVYWDAFGRYTYCTFDLATTLPDVLDCGTYYIGGIVDDANAWPERYEDNNTTLFTNGLPFSGSTFVPTALTIGLGPDAYEPNDSFATAAAIPADGYINNLSIDQDGQEDWYRFTLSCAKQLDTIIHFSNDAGNIDVELRDHSNALLQGAYHTWDNEQIYRHLDAGTYYLRVFGVGAGSCNRYSITISTDDTTPPVGEITHPENGACSGGSVTILDNFSDACGGALTREYHPGPGPDYSNHGDYDVVLTVKDAAENQATDRVSFTIDKVPPVVQIKSPLPGNQILPSSVPLNIQFVSSDEDGAIGGVTREVIYLAGCPVYDGATFGDGDGLLSDEALPLTQQELCRLATLCGFSVLEQPELRIAATDCGGNTGFARMVFSGSVKLKPGLCGN